MPRKSQHSLMTVFFTAHREKTQIVKHAAKFMKVLGHMKLQNRKGVCAHTNCTHVRIKVITSENALILSECNLFS